PGSNHLAGSRTRALDRRLPRRTRQTVVWVRHGQGPEGPGVDYTAAPALSRWGQETCRLSSRLQGVVRLSGGSGLSGPGDWQQAVRSRVLPPSTRGSTYPPGQHLAPMHSSAWDSGVAAGCKVVGGSTGIRQPACAFGLGSQAPFEGGTGCPVFTTRYHMH